jgi:signal transduction histidine kinase
MLAELDEAYRSLDRSNQQLRQFLADCSHELRTPLARIRSTVDLLARTGEDDADDVAFRSRALADVATEADRMGRMVRQLLILARADAGATIEPRPVDLGQVLDAVRRPAERMSDALRLHTPPPGTLAGVTVRGDADHLTQLLLILLDNAVKYTPPPGEVGLQASHEGGQARITVTDTGLGIPPEDTERIFERFYRGRNGGAATGTGLGLAIARWVVEQHAGRIEVQSRADGSRFTVVLPLPDQ